MAPATRATAWTALLWTSGPLRSPPLTKTGAETMDFTGHFPVAKKNRKKTMGFGVLVYEPHPILEKIKISFELKKNGIDLNQFSN